VEGKDRAKLNKLINIQVKLLEKIIPDNIYGFDEEMPEENIGKLLLKNKLTLATAESCSGGHLAHKITSVPGASEYFLGSVVAYSNKVKTNMVKVPEKIITKHGAVSKEVVESMAENISKIFSSDCSIATSGIAGPGGGTKEKPTGTTWIAVFYNGKIRSEKFNFGENRERNIVKTSYTAINMLRKLIITEST
jgi:nicotinamide-nucleotide amidase